MSNIEYRMNRIEIYDLIVVVLLCCFVSVCLLCWLCCFVVLLFDLVVCKQSFLIWKCGMNDKFTLKYLLLCWIELLTVLACVLHFFFWKWLTTHKEDTVPRDIFMIVVVGVHQHTITSMVQYSTSTVAVNVSSSLMTWRNNARVNINFKSIVTLYLNGTSAKDVRFHVHIMKS